MSLVITVLLASLAGSLHCAAMCGGLLAVCFAGQGCGGAPGRAPGIQLRYHLGRLVSYCLLGAAGGGLGSVVDLGGGLADVQRLSAIFAGLFIILWALWPHLKRASATGPTRPSGAARLSRFVLGRAAAVPANRRAVVIGVLSAVLPCGWLYAFVLAAAGTGSAALGALVMLAFWAGTVPALVGAGLGVHALLGRLRTRVPVLATVLLIALGLATLSHRYLLAGAITPPAPGSFSASCCDGGE